MQTNGLTLSGRGGGHICPPPSTSRFFTLDQLYTQLCSVLKHASDDSIPVCKIHTHHDHIVPGFTEFAKQLHSEARADYLLWKASGKPRAGLLYFNMCQSRIRFKRTLIECRQNEEINRANEHAKSLMEKDMTSL